MVRELQVNLILHECLQLLYAGQRILSQLSVPLFVDLQRIVRLLYAQLFLKIFHIGLKLVHIVINLCLELAHISFHSVHGIVNLVFYADNLTCVCESVHRHRNLGHKTGFIFEIMWHSGIRLFEMLD